MQADLTSYMTEINYASRSCIKIMKGTTQWKMEESNSSSGDTAWFRAVSR